MWDLLLLKALNRYLGVHELYTLRLAHEVERLDN